MDELNRMHQLHREVPPLQHKDLCDAAGRGLPQHSANLVHLGALPGRGLAAVSVLEDEKSILLICHK